MIAGQEIDEGIGRPSAGDPSAEAAYRRGYHHAVADMLNHLDSGAGLPALRRHERLVRRWREDLRRSDRAVGFVPPPPLSEDDA